MLRQKFDDELSPKKNVPLSYTILSSQPYEVKLNSSISELFSHVTYKRRTETKLCFFAHGLLYTYSSAEQIEMTDKSLHSVSVFVGVVVKHFYKIEKN